MPKSSLPPLLSEQMGFDLRREEVPPSRRAVARARLPAERWKPSPLSGNDVHLDARTRGRVSLEVDGVSAPPAMVSLPLPPLRLSTFPPPARESSPEPPQSRSTPPRPRITSFPPRPTITSLRGVPLKTSLRLVPTTVAPSRKHWGVRAVAIGTPAICVRRRAQEIEIAVHKRPPHLRLPSLFSRTACAEGAEAGQG